MSKDQQENIIHVMTNEFPAGSGKKRMRSVFYREDDSDYKPAKSFAEMLANNDFYNIFKRACGFWNSAVTREITVRLMGRQIWCYIRNIHMKMCAVFLTGSKMRCH